MSIEIVDQDNGFDKFFDDIEELSSMDVEVGYTQSSGGGVADVAILMEMGGESEISPEYRARALSKGVDFGKQTTIQIPSRPAMRTSFDNNTGELGEKGEKLLEKFIDGKIDAGMVYEVWGDEYRNMFRNGVISREFDFIDNSDRTIKIKDSETPWIDSGRVLGAADVMVNKK